ncbi:creatininase [candidate division WWE3 bacterium CG_4_9_14_3_um_filter_43_9]|uniref:Creatininase n=2 Tax=Katanobacteria TaxID=422282 RepID=A0A2M7TAI2_UNCKA|nr:MAG: creatinine amidohydrolase [bacterium CG1_02_42_9]PIZ41983.1 MAG: creatininase [candidate division WWE3 bacterium CG_4_10_14_0_2_um_filter_42_8]PJA37345.1 MAG: creatininase [candidate division WWE3 bacterium CG_4_9_14_3_um_filter_43_9]
MEKQKSLKSFWLNELTWEEVAEYLKEDDIVLVPVGSTEEHGPAGPLGLDTYVAIALAEDVAQKTGVLVVPPLWFGDSDHHLGFAGTISLRTETLIQVIKDVTRSLARHGFRKLIFINGHKKANLPAINTALKDLHEYELPQVLLAVVDPVKIAGSIASKIKEHKEHHAGELEISEVWYKYPKLIRQEKLTKEEVNFEKVFSPFFQDDLFGAGKPTIDIMWNSKEQKEFAPSGSFSASDKASSQKGKKYHDYMVEVVVQFVRWLKAYKGPIGNQ